MKVKFNTSIPTKLNIHYRKELKAFDTNLKLGELASAWKHLERAHILGQPYPIEHTYVHWLMLKLGFHIKNGREILGQLPRLIFGGVKSFVGTIPVGNTGGANIPPLKSLPIPEDLNKIIQDSY